MKVTTITDLHENNILDILCFLPPKSIIGCSCVCKDWANLIYQPYFPQVYFSSGKAPLQLLLEREDDCIVLAQLDKSLYTASYPLNFSIPKKAIFVINIPQIFGISSSVFLTIFTCRATCWILAIHRSWTDPQLHKAYQLWYYMYNPITGQRIVEQKAIREDVVWETGALIFAQKSNQLKLLAFSGKERRGPEETYVLTIGTNTWRSIGELPCYSVCGQPVLVDGLCYWLNNEYELIYTFDPEEEIFQVIQTPSCFNKHKWSYLGSLDGCLCLSLAAPSQGCHIWVMNKYGIQDSWTKKFFISDIGEVEPLACLENREILMICDRDVCVWEKHSPMICFDPCSRKCRSVRFRKGLEKIRLEE